MERRYVTGIDWSGDLGEPSNAESSRWIVLSAVHIPSDEIEALTNALLKARRRRKLPDHYVFKYSGSRPAIRESLFEALSNVDFRSTILGIDKRTWSFDELHPIHPNVRLAASLANLIIDAPPECTSGCNILVDLPRSEKRVIAEIQGQIRSAIRQEHRRPIKSLRPVPESRLEGSVIQVADMLAGWKHDDLLGTADRLPAKIADRIRHL